MSKRLATILAIIAILMVILYIVVGSMSTKKQDAYDSEKETYHTTKYNIKDLKQQKESNNVVLDRADKDPTKVAKTATDTASKFIKAVKKSNVGTEEQRYKNYDKNLRGLALPDVTTDDALLHMRIPNDFKVYPGTSKGQTVQVLVVDANKGLDESSHVVELSVDTVNERVTSYAEYNIREKGGDE